MTKSDQVPLYDPNSIKIESILDLYNQDQCKFPLSFDLICSYKPEIAYFMENNLKYNYEEVKFSQL